MIKDFLVPVDNNMIKYADSLSENCIGSLIGKYTETGFPELGSFNIALIFVNEGRGSEKNYNTGLGSNIVRKHFYSLYKGAWDVDIIDLGNLNQGEKVTDTYVALNKIVEHLLELNVIPVVIGGGQELTYSSYRAYDAFNQTVNLVSVDSKFNLGKSLGSLDTNSFMSHVILNKPNRLFNFSNIGYQTYYNSQESIHFMEQLHFDVHRLGTISNDITLAEPIMRDADIVSIDISSVRKSEAPGNANATPNGFFGNEICAISRYAGISDKLSSFGIYEYNPDFDDNEQTAQLIAQMLWYFSEGVASRLNDYPYCTKDEYYKYIVPVKDEDMYFYKSNKSDRWWIDVPFSSNFNSENIKHSLIPCSYNDYLKANEQEVPERWINAYRKLV